ncbi:MAG TPA: ECF-type sigma factor [Gemmatimonadaceae bacterium]|jgi:RNA polymerase sigma factor (TIGR02999 family)|nr:ECF-type sigma factor [Gemmatimonadaceae bacterium]
MHLDAIDSPKGEVTRLLHAARDGDATAMDRIIQLVYDDLCAIAARQLRREPFQRTTQPASLVHEAYMKLANGAALHAGDRAHFLALAGRAMRQVLVEHARRRSAAKRRPMELASLGDDVWATPVSPEEILTLNDAIDQLEPRQRQVVECRFFGGLEEREIAATLGVDERTVRRDWVKARAWLYQALYGAASA